MPDKEAAKEELRKLIAKYEAIVAEGKVKQYNEERTKKDFILPLFKTLGWATETEEVTAEDKVSKGRVDYGFRINEALKLVVEAKPLRADLDKLEYSEQAVDYAWHKGISWAVLTNFEKIILFNADLKLQNPLQNAKLRLSYKQFLDRFEDLWLLSKESIEGNALEAWGQRYAVGPKKVEVGEQILADLMEWREWLTKDINKHSDNKKVSGTEKELDESVQRILDRLIFIRTCEDRDFEEKLLHQLLEDWKSSSRKSLFGGLVKIFEYFNENYDSKLFLPHSCDKLAITNEVLALVLDGLYRTKDKSIRYDFSLIEADVLGSIYENYLGHVLRQTAKRVKVTDTPNHRKQLGIYYTPPYIVDYIVKNTLGELLRGKKADEIKDIKVLDPACGSGSFLIKAFDVVSEAYKQKNGEELPFSKKKDILTNNIFGVDLDPKAVEIAQLNLMLKAVEKKKLLPMLQNNVKVGNSLIDDPAVSERAFKWEEQFSEIMKKGGFDVVVGNPPYVRQEEFLPIKHYLETNYEVYHGTADIFAYFFEREFKVLKPGGYLGMIVSNKWLKAGYGLPLRKFLNKFWIEQFMDFGDLPVFKDAATYPCILIIKKTPKQNRKMLVCKIDNLSFSSLHAFVEENKFIMDQNELDDVGWNFQTRLSSKIMDKLKSVSMPLKTYIKNEVYRGVLTGLNEAFVISEETKHKLIMSDPKSSEIIKPFLTGADVRRYNVKPSKKYLIFTRRGIDIGKYPAIKKYLEQFKIKLMPKKDERRAVGRKPGDYEWYEIQDVIAYFKEFEKTKILYGVITTSPRFTLDTKGYFCNNANFFVPTDDKKLLGILNSRLGWFLISNVCTQIRGGYQLIWKYFGNVPIAKAPSKEIEKLVDKMLSLNKRLNELGDRNTDEKLRVQEEIRRTDAEIDELVYKLYGITDEEKRIIEDSLR